MDFIKGNRRWNTSYKPEGRKCCLFEAFLASLKGRGMYNGKHTDYLPLSVKSQGTQNPGFGPTPL